METVPVPKPAIDLATRLHILTGPLPPPVDDNPVARHTRNRAGLAKVTVLLPIDANTADLAPRVLSRHSIAARAIAAGEGVRSHAAQAAGDLRRAKDCGVHLIKWDEFSGYGF